jgi:hypothetical protein
LFICAAKLLKMQKFDAIRPFYDAEIDAILKVINHPMMKALMNFTFRM